MRLNIYSLGVQTPPDCLLRKNWKWWEAENRDDLFSALRHSEIPHFVFAPQRDLFTANTGKSPCFVLRREIPRRCHERTLMIARGSGCPEERVKLLDSGAAFVYDDSTPVCVLVAHLEAIDRRRIISSFNQLIGELGKYRYELNRTEYALFESMVLLKGEVAVRKSEDIGVTIFKLRSKLEEINPNLSIENVKGKGYRIVL